MGTHLLMEPSWITFLLSKFEFFFLVFNFDHFFSQVISNFGVGTDHIRSDEAKKRGIKVGNTPNVLNDTVADMAFALLLAIARNVVTGDVVSRDPNLKHFDSTWFEISQICLFFDKIEWCVGTAHKFQK